MFANFIANIEDKVSSKPLFWSVFISLALLSAIGNLTKFSDLPHQLIGHADQANIAIVARNISEGKGAVVDSIWLLTDGGIEGDAIPAPEPYWSKYTAAVIAFFFCLFTDSLTVMLIPAVIIKTAIATLATIITVTVISRLAKYHPIPKILCPIIIFGTL